MKKFLAFLCLLTIVLLFPITLLGTVAKYRLVTPAAIKQVVRSSRVAEYLPELIAAAMTSASAADTATAELPALDASAAEDLVTRALPPEDVYSITDQTIDALGVWIKTDKPVEQLDFKVDLTKLKQNLAPAISERLNVYLEDLPTCSAGALPNELPDFDAAALESMDTIDCLPANFDIAALVDSSGVEVGDTVLQNVPDQLTADTIITEQLQGSNVSMQSLNAVANQVRSTWRWLSIGIWVGWGIIGFCLVLMLLLRLRPLHAAFSWLGWTHLFLTLELIPLVLTLWFAPQFILPWLSSSANLVGLTLMSAILTQTMRVLTWPIVWTLIGTAAATVLYFVLHFILKHASKPAAPAMVTPPTSNSAAPSMPQTTTPPSIQPPPQ